MAADVETYSIRRMQREEIPQAVAIWTETGLAEGTHTVATWFAVDPHGFYVAATEAGELYGVCAAVVLNDNLAFIGLYAVRQKYQRRGIGIKIWRKAMEHVGGRNVGLNSVPEHLHTYRDLAGFSVVTKWQTVVCESASVNTELLRDAIPGTEVHIIDDVILPNVIDYDETVHGYSRSKIVSLSVKEGESISMAAVNDGGRICGYGSLKKNVQGPALVGPLYADNRDIAELLLKKLIFSFAHAQLYGLTLMIVDCNKEVLILIKKLGLQMTTKVPRCYLKEEVNVHFEKIFGQHALNFSTF